MPLSFNRVAPDDTLYRPGSGAEVRIVEVDREHRRALVEHGGHREWWNEAQLGRLRRTRPEGR